MGGQAGVAHAVPHTDLAKEESMILALRFSGPALRMGWLVGIGVVCGLAALAEEAKAPETKNDAPPTITRVEPIVGPTAGGEEARIFGEGFRSGCEVFFGNEKVKPEQVKVEKMGTLIVVKTPQGRGRTDVRVVNPDKQVVMRSGAYFYGRGVSAGMFRFRHGLELFWFWFDAGGWVMYPILFLSFLALALILHCMLSYRENQFIPTELVESVAEHLSNGNLDRASELCRKHACPFGRVILAGIQRADQSPEIIRDAMAGAGVREADHLNQKVQYLSNIGTIAPMLGLFGTVWGLQMAFQTIAGAAGQTLLLAGAISVALNTTIAGLIVGVISFVGYFLFRGRIVRLISTMEILAEEMAERIIQHKGAEE
jgi:biopolymer transport protein ExbB